MLIQSDKTRTSPWPAALTLVAIAALVATWLWTRTTQPDEIASATDGPFQSGPGTPGAADLQTLHVEIEPQHAAILQAARDRAIATQVLVTRDDEIVPARVRLGDGPTQDARVRLKGDWVDHVDTDKWSLRVELRDGKQLGMSSYSIQHPKTRGVLFEWLIMAIARRDGLLAPRSTYVNVAINSRENGVYYLEEHFTKELLESQGRRDGPIVKFREDTLWSAWRQYEYQQRGLQPLPPIVNPATEGHVAEISAFDEKRFGKVESLNARLQRALERLRQAQRVALAEAPNMPLANLEALDELRGETLDDLFVPDRLGRMMALFLSFKALHGAMWHQLRFYHDPVLDRLEPIVFDTGADPLGVEPLEALLPVLLDINRADDCFAAGFRALAEITEPEYMDAVFAELGPDLDRFAAALIAEGLAPAAFQTALLRQALTANCARLRSLIAPEDPVNFHARQVEGIDADGESLKMLEVEAWATTLVPVELHGFTFSNGRTVPAAAALSPEDDRFRRESGRVALPRHGQRITLRFPTDARLSRLRDVQQIKRAIREQGEKDRNVAVQVDAVFARIGADEPQRERLRIRQVGDSALPTTGRPKPPTLLEALDRHPCLTYDFDRGRLLLRPGTWDVEGDLAIPAGLVLETDGATTLRFAPGALLISESPLRLTGTAEAPIVLEPRDDAAGWSGLIVFETRSRSLLQHVTVRGTNAFERGGWQSTGGVTFYRAPVDLLDTTFLDARGEDSLNVFGCDLRMHRTKFVGGASDLFDGDFVTGEIVGCEFGESVEDAIDVSGSTVTVTGCRFDAIGDKALSIGENSQATIRDCAVTRAAIALAAKDLSRVDCENLRADAVDHFLIAVYIKKPAYGGSTVTARNVAAGSVGRENYLVQTDCSLEVDGTAIPTVEVDVEDLYRRKILGK